MVLLGTYRGTLKDGQTKEPNTRPSLNRMGNSQLWTWFTLGLWEASINATKISN